MINQLIAQLVDQYVREFLGDWDPVENLKIGSLTEPEVNLTNVPLPQFIFDIAEIPFIVDYSNIAKVHAKFTWGTFLGRYETNPLSIDVEDAEVRIRFAYPSEWDAEKWEQKLLKSKLKRAAMWQKFASLFATHTADKSIAQSIECRVVNALKIRAKNLHVQIVDDHFAAVPFCFDIYVAEFNIDSPKPDDPRISSIEKDGLSNLLLSAMWMRFVGLHLFYREFGAPVLPDRRATDRPRRHRRRKSSVLGSSSKRGSTKEVRIDQEGKEKGMKEKEEKEIKEKKDARERKDFKNVKDADEEKNVKEEVKKMINQFHEEGRDEVKKESTSHAPNSQIGLPITKNKLRNYSVIPRLFRPNPDSQKSKSSAVLSGGNTTPSGYTQALPQGDNEAPPKSPSNQSLQNSHGSSDHLTTLAPTNRSLPSVGHLPLQVKRQNWAADVRPQGDVPPSFQSVVEHQKSYEDNDESYLVDAGRDGTRSKRRKTSNFNNTKKFCDRTMDPSDFASVISDHFQFCPIHGVLTSIGDPRADVTNTIGASIRCSCTPSSDPIRTSNEKTASWIHSLISQLRGIRREEEREESSIDSSNMREGSSQSPVSSDIPPRERKEDSRRKGVWLGFGRPLPFGVSRPSRHPTMYRFIRRGADNNDNGDCPVFDTSVEHAVKGSVAPADIQRPSVITFSESLEGISNSNSLILDNERIDRLTGEAIRPELFRHETQTRQSFSQQPSSDDSPYLSPQVPRYVKNNCRMEAILGHSTISPRLLHSASLTSTEEVVNKPSRVLSLKSAESISPQASVRKRVRRPKNNFKTAFSEWRKRPPVPPTKSDMDILPPNDKALRMTPQDGIEMHIFYKKWELRALAKYDLSQVHWKSVELSFIPHHPPVGPPKKKTEGEAEGEPSENSDSDSFLGHVTPVFDGSVIYGPLHIVFTAAALQAFWGFIKFLDLWFVFIRGVARNIRQDPVPELVDPYFELWKKKISGGTLTEDEVKGIENIEYQLPLYAMLGTRERAETSVYGSLGLAGLARQIRDGVGTVCGGMAKMFGVQEGRGECCKPEVRPDLDELRFNDEAGVKNGRVNDFHWFGRDSWLEVVIPDMRVEIIPPVGPGRHIQGTPLQPMSPDACGPVFSATSVPRLSRRMNSQVNLKRRGGFRTSDNGTNRFIRVKVPGGRSAKQRLNFSKNGVREDHSGSAAYQQYIKSKMPHDAVAHLGTAEAFVACAALRYISDKTHDHLKTNYVFVDNLSIIERPVEFLICRASDVYRREYPINSLVQVPLPSFLIIPRRLPNSKLTVAVAQAQHYTALKTHLQKISETPYRDIVEDVSLRFDDAHRWSSSIPASPFFLPAHDCRPAFKSPEPFIRQRFRDDNSAACPSWTMTEIRPPTPTVVASEVPAVSKFAAWKKKWFITKPDDSQENRVTSRAGSLDRPSTNFPSYTPFSSKPNIHPESRLTVVIDDLLTLSKKKTLVALPHVVTDANRVLALAAVFPPASEVDRDLFEKIDAIIPDSTREAENLGYFCAAKIKSLEIQISKACCMVKSPVHEGLQSSENYLLQRGLSKLGLAVASKRNSAEIQHPNGKFYDPLVRLVSRDEPDHNTGRLQQSKNNQRRDPGAAVFKPFKSYRPNFRALDSVDDGGEYWDETYRQSADSSGEADRVEDIRDDLLKVSPLVSDVAILVTGFSLVIAADKTHSVNIGNCSVMARIADEFVNPTFNASSLIVPPLKLPSLPQIRNNRQPTDSLELFGWKEYNLDFLLSSIRVAYITDFSLVKTGGDKTDPSLCPVIQPVTVLDSGWSQSSSSSSSSEYISCSSGTESLVSSSLSDARSSTSTETAMKSEGPVRVQMGVATVDVALGYAALSTGACWKSFTFQGVDLKDVLYRLKSFVAPRKLNRETGFAEYNSRLVWQPKFKSLSETPSISDEKFQRQFVDPVTGGTTLVDFMGGLPDNINADVPAENLSSVAVDVSQSEKKLDLEIAAGRIGIIVFDNTEARFALQVFSSHCRFVNRVHEKACHASISEIHMSHVAPTSPTEFHSSIVLAKNAVHIGYNMPPHLDRKKRVSTRRKRNHEDRSFPSSLSLVIPQHFSDAETQPTNGDRLDQTKGEGGHASPTQESPMLQLYPDVVFRNRLPPTELSHDLENLNHVQSPPNEADGYGLQYLFAESKPRSNVVRVFLDPSDMVGSPTPSTAVSDGHHSGNTSTINEQSGASSSTQSTEHSPPTQYRATTQTQPMAGPELLPNPAVKTLERFPLDSVPHVTVNFSSSEREATQQVLGELRSVYLFLSPGLVTTASQIVQSYHKFFIEESDRNRICQATLISNESADAANDVEVFETFCFARSLTGVVQRKMDEDLDMIQKEDEEEDLSFDSDVKESKQLILALTLDNINIHPVYCNSPIPAFDSNLSNQETKEGDYAERRSKDLSASDVGFETLFSVDGWPMVISASQLHGLEPSAFDDSFRVAVIDFDNIGLRLMLSVEAVITQTKGSMPLYEPAPVDGPSRDGFRDSEGYDPVTKQEESHWTRLEVDAKLRRLEVNVLRNATWLIASLVLPGMEASVALWRRSDNPDRGSFRHSSQSSEFVESLKGKMPVRFQSDDASNDSRSDPVEAPANVVLDFISLEILQLAVWYASYWDKTTGTAIRGKSNTRTGYTLPSIEELENLFPPPMCIGLSWAPHFVAPPTANRRTANPSPQHPGAQFQFPEESETPPASVDRDLKRQKVVDKVYGMLATESWCNPKAGLALPSRPPFARHIINVRTALLPVVYANSCATVAGSDGDGGGGASRSRSPSEKTKALDGKPSHFSSIHIAPTSVVIEPHMMRGVSEVSKYIRFWIDVAKLKARAADTVSVEVNSSVAAVEGGKVGESALGKLTSSAKAMQAMQKGQEKLGGNLFLDVQVDHFEVIMATIDSVVSAPKLPATLLTHQLLAKTKERYRDCINGIAIKGLPYFDIVCLSHQSLPTATLHTGVAVQMVGTKREDLFPVTYNNAVIASAFNSNFSLISGNPPKRTALPPLLSLISFSRASASPVKDSSTSRFFAFCVHVPLFSVGLAMSRASPREGTQSWTGLIRRQASKPLENSDSEDEQEASERLRNTRNLANVLQLSIGKFDFEAFKVPDSETVCTFISVGQASFKDAAGKNLLKSTALLKRYFGSSRLTPGVNFNPLYGFPRLAKQGAQHRFSAGESSMMNQIDASLLFGQKKVRGGVEIRCSRLEIGVDSLQLLDNCVRALLKSMKDMKALAVHFPKLVFKETEHSSAQTSAGFPQFGFGSIIALQVDSPFPTKDYPLSALPPLAFVSHVPDVFRNVELSSIAPCEKKHPKPPAVQIHLQPEPNGDRAELIPIAFQLISFPYDLPSRIEFESTAESDWSESSGEEADVPRRLPPASVFELRAPADPTKVEPARLSGLTESRTTLRPEKNPPEEWEVPFSQENVVLDQSTPKARSVMAFPSGESFATVDDGRTQPRPMRAFRDRVVALFRRKISAGSSSDLGAAPGLFDGLDSENRPQTAGLQTERTSQPRFPKDEAGQDTPTRKDRRFSLRNVSMGGAAYDKTDQFEQFDANLEVEIDIAIEALEVWIWPLTNPEPTAKPPQMMIKKSDKPRASKSSDLSQLRAAIVSDESPVSSLGTEQTIETEPSFASATSKAGSIGPIENMGMRPTQNIVHPRMLQQLRLQAFTTSTDVGTLAGSKASSRYHIIEQPVTGIIISVVVHLVKNASGVRGAAHLVETNIMLGRPEGPISAPYQRKPHNLSMSTLIPIDENFSQSFMKDPSATATSSGFGVLRGVRIRKEHRVDFPFVLIGFGGGVFVSNMSSKDREDCLFTLQKVLVKMDYIQGPQISLLPHPDGAPQYHCYTNLLVDQPQLHLSLDTLWSLDDLLKSIKEFMNTIIGRWKSQPPTMSRYLIESGILHAVHTNFNLPFSSVPVDHMRPGETTESPEDSDIPDNSPLVNEDGEISEIESDSHNGQPRCLSPLSSGSLSNTHLSPEIVPSFFRTSGQGDHRNTGHDHNTSWSPTGSTSGVVGYDGEYGSRIASFAYKLGGRSTVDSQAARHDDFDREVAVGLEDEEEEVHDERLDHKILRFFYKLCSIGEQQVPIHITANIGDLSVNLHDAYVQLLQIRIVKTNVKAILPMIKDASLTLDLLMGLTTFNPLIRSTERALDPVGVRLSVRRRLAGDSEKEDCPWLEINLDVDRLGLEVSSGLLQVMRRLQDLFGTARGSNKALGKMKSVTIFNDLKTPVILLQKGINRALGADGGSSLDWNHMVLDERQCCSSLVDTPMFFAVNRTPERKLTSSGSSTSVAPKFREKKAKRESADPTLVLKTNIETEEDLKRLAFEILKLGNSSFAKHLNDFLHFYQKPLLYGTTRNVEFILELMADQIPMLSGAVKTRWGLSGFGNIFNILRNEPGWVPVGKLRPDYQTNRAYFIANHGFKVVVEPETTASSGDWKLCIGTAIQIVNGTSIPFKVFTSKRFGVVRRFAKRLQGDIPAPTARAHETKSEANSPNCMIINPHSRRSVPLAWFFNGRSPFILPLIEDEQSESIYTKLGGQFHANRNSAEIPVLPEVKVAKPKRRTISLPVLRGATTTLFQPLLTPQPFAVLQRLLTKLSGPDSDETWKRITVEDSILKYRRQLAWDVSIDVTDIPTNIPNKTAHKYSIRIAPYLTLRNSLPFPVTLCLYPSRAAAARGMATSHFAGRPSSVVDEDTAVEDARRMLQGRPMRAHIPPHHLWGIPSQSQRLSFKLFVHGTPIEIFSAPAPMDRIEKVMKKLDRHQRGFTQHSENESPPGVGSDVPIYSSSKMSLWLPTSDTHTCKIGMAHKRGLSLDDDFTLLQFAPLCKRLNTESQLSPVTNMYRTFSVTADASRQLVTIFAPYFVENLCRDVFVIFNNRLVPPGSRLYVSDDDAKVARIRALRGDLRATADSTGRLQLSTISGKLDLTSTATTRSPVILKFNFGGSGPHRGKNRRKLKWASHEDDRHEKLVVGDGRPFSDPSESSVMSGPFDSSDQRDASAASGHFATNRIRLFSAIPEEDSLAQSVIEDDVEEPDDDDDIEQQRKPRTGTSHASQSGGMSPAFLRVRDRFRAALVSRTARASSTDSGESQVANRTSHRSRIRSETSDTDFHAVDITIAEDDDEDSSARRSVPPSHQHLSTPSTNAPVSPNSHLLSSPRFIISQSHAASLPQEVEVSAKKRSAMRDHRSRTSTDSSDIQQVVQMKNKLQTFNDAGLITSRQQSPVSLSPRLSFTPIDNKRDGYGDALDPPKPRRASDRSDATKLSVRVHEPSSFVRAATPTVSPSLLRPAVKRSPRGVVSSFYSPTGQSTFEDDIETADNSPPLSSRTLISPNPSIQSPSPAPSVISSTQSPHINTSSVVSLGLAVRYANAPYGVSKVISIMPRHLFYSRLPFLVLIKDVKASQTLKLGVGRSSKEPQTQLVLPSGDCLPFHTSENRVCLQMPTAGRLLTCPAFSLVPSDVPSTFQVELTASLSSHTREDIQQVIQVNVVSGYFSEKVGRNGLPYTYNGLFFVLSIPEFSNFQVRNLTKFTLEFVSTGDKLPVATEAFHKNRRNRSKQVEEVIPGLHIREQYEEPTKKPTARASRELQPHRRMIYVPHDKSNKVNVRMRVMNVKSSGWKTVSLSTVHSSPTVIQFETFADRHLTRGSSNVASYPTDGEGTKGRHEISLRDDVQPILSTGRDNVIKRRFYAFLTVDSRGSRILTVTESRRLVERLKAGQVIWNPRRTGKEYSEDVKSEGVLSPEDKRKPLNSIKQRRNGDDLRFITERGKSERQYKVCAVRQQDDMKSVQLPWLGISFQFVIPKITLTWTTQSEVILALHLSGIRLSSFIAPTRLARLSGGAAALENILISGSSNHHHHKHSDGERRSGYWWSRGVEQKGGPLDRQTSTPAWNLPKVKIREDKNSLQPSAIASREQQHAVERELKLREWAKHRKYQDKRYLDLETEMFTNSEVRIEFSIGAIHCDHFVEGDVPVILKSTNSGDEMSVAPFFYVHVTKSVVDPTFAPIYDGIEVTISPLAVNVELLVVEQLISLGEKEYISIQLASPIEEDECIDSWEEEQSVEQHKPAAKAEESLIIWLPTDIIATVNSSGSLGSPLPAEPSSIVGLHSFTWRDQPMIDPVTKAQLLLPGADGSSHSVFEVSENIQSSSSSYGGTHQNHPDMEFAHSWPSESHKAGFVIPLRSIVEMFHGQAADQARMDRTWERHRGLQHELDAIVATGVQEMLTSYQILTTASEGTRYESKPKRRKEHTTKGLRQEAQRAFESKFDILFLPSSGFSHWLIFPMPRWAELKDARPVYIKSLRINSFVLTISIRTSNKRISRQILHIVDALPLDTPYMGLQISSEKRQYAVSTWGELLHSLRNSYLKQLIRQTLPSAWLFNPLAFATGTWRGGRALVSATAKGARSGRTCSIEGSINGFRLGMVMFFLYSIGGIFQTCSHFGNLLHKALGGSRPRPQGVLDSMWKGIDGFFEDTFVTPWVALYSAPVTANSRGDGFWMVLFLFIGCFLRCLICPVFGFLNLFTSVTEGFANALIGDFEQFARMQEQSDLLAKAQRRTNGLPHGDRRKSPAEITHTMIPGFSRSYGAGSGSISGTYLTKR